MVEPFSVEELPPGTWKVSIMGMENPSTFWVEEPPGQDMTPARQELQNMEEIMCRFFRRSAYNAHTSPYLAEAEELVAVQNSTTKRWHRGEVKTVLNTAKCLIFEVFLVDHGITLKARSSEIRTLPPKMTRLRYQAFQVGLYGIFPTTVDVDFAESKMKRVVSKSWTVAARTFVEGLLQDSSGAYLIHKLFGKRVYGEILLGVAGGLINLGDELCEREFAVKDEELFFDIVSKEKSLLNDVDGDMSLNTSPSVSMLDVSSVSKADQFCLENDVKKSQEEMKTYEGTRKLIDGEIHKEEDESERHLKMQRWLAKVDEMQKESMDAFLREEAALSNLQLQNSAIEEESCRIQTSSKPLKPNSLSEEMPSLLPTGVKDNELPSGTKKPNRIVKLMNLVDAKHQKKSAVTPIHSELLQSREATAESRDVPVLKLTQNSNKVPIPVPPVKSEKSKYKPQTSVRVVKLEQDNNKFTPGSYSIIPAGANMNRALQKQTIKNNDCVTSPKYEEQYSLSPMNLTFVESSQHSQSQEVDDSISQPPNTPLSSRNMNGLMNKVVPNPKLISLKSQTIHKPKNSNLMELMNKLPPKNDSSPSQAAANITEETISNNTCKLLDNHVKYPPGKPQNKNSKDNATVGTHDTEDETELSKSIELEVGTGSICSNSSDKTTISRKSILDKVISLRTRKSQIRSTCTKDTQRNTEADCHSTFSQVSDSQASLLTHSTCNGTSVKSKRNNFDKISLKQRIDQIDSKVDDTQSVISLASSSWASVLTNSTTNGVATRAKVGLLETLAVFEERKNQSQGLPSSPQTSQPFLSVLQNGQPYSLLDRFKQQEQSQKEVPTPTKARLPKCALEKFPSPGSVASISSSDTSSLSTDIQQIRNVSKLSRLEPELVDLPAIEVGGLRPRQHLALGMSERLQSDTVLVRGDYTHCKPLVARTQAEFCKEVHQGLDSLGFHDPMRIQRYTWPALLRGHTLVMVSPPRSGKTLAYAAPLVSFLFQEGLYADLPGGNAPKMLILCSSSVSAQHIYNTCTQLMKCNPQLTALVTYGGGKEMEQKVPLLNGCDILVSTPKCFLRLLSYAPLLTSLNRLAHLVLDEADVLTLKFMPQVITIMKEIQAMMKKRRTTVKDASIQMVLAAEKWCPGLETLVGFLPRPRAVCIASHLEAAVYARLKPTLHFIEPHMRISTVCGILEEQQGLFKTVVVCDNVKEVQELTVMLQQCCQYLLVAHEDMLHININDVHNQWMSMDVSGRYPVLVCSDGVLRDLKLQDAMWLVHYSLPADSKTAFGRRFSCLMGNYREVLETPKKDDSMLAPECSVHILLDESNTQQLPPIVRFMKRLGAAISPTLEATTEETAHKKELLKGDVPLCYSIKSFGDCWDKSACPSRHVVKISDAPTNIPKSGTVRIKILNVHDACNFSVRLLEHTNAEGRTLPVPDQYLSIAMGLGAYFRNPRNRVVHSNPKINDICAVETKLNLYQRAQVVAVTKTDSADQPEEVQVCYLDDGNKEELKVLKLLTLPSKLQTPPPQVVEVFLCRLAPCDLDWGWSQAASLKVYEWFKEANDCEADGQFMVGKIMLSLGNSLWLEPLECHQPLPDLGTTTIVRSFRRSLLSAKLAVNNPHHLERLYALCSHGDLELPQPEPAPQPVVSPPKPREAVQVQWAHLDAEEWQTVTFITGSSPHHFFVRPIKFEDLVNTMIKQMQIVAEENMDHSEVLEEGSYCLGKFPDDELWYRAQVQTVEDDKLKLFFVDHGDDATVNRAEAVPVDDKWLTKLPFQAIECSLVGVNHLDSESTWSKEATDALFEITSEEDDGPVKLLALKVCEKLHPAVATGGYHYRIVLVDTPPEGHVVLNQLLIDRGLAVLVLEEASMLEGLAPPQLELEELSSDSNHSDVDENPQDTLQDAELLLPEADNKQVAILNGADAQLDYLIAFTERCDKEELLDFYHFSWKRHAKALGEALGQSSTSIHSLSSDDECDDSLLKSPQITEKQYEDATNIPPLSSCSKSTEEQREDARNVPQLLSCPKSIEEQHEDAMNVPQLLSSTRSPQVFWHQDSCCVWLDIRLVGVEKYHLAWTADSLDFSTNIDGGVYWLKVELYGNMDPTILQHSAKGLQVIIKLFKALKGYSWPRLLKMEGRYSWLKYNFEYEEVDTDSYRRFLQCDKSMTTLSKVEQSQLKECPIVPDFAMFDSDHDNDSGSDVMDLDHEDEHYDPFDPLS